MCENIEPNEKELDFEDLLNQVGGFGRSSIKVYALMSLMGLPVGAQLLVPVFYGAAPDFHCVDKHWPNSTVGGDVGQCFTNCTRYEFEESFTSAVSEWELVCERAHLKATTQAVYMAGIMIGSIVLGSLSDHWGRKTTTFIGNAMLAVFGVSSAWVEWPELFVVLRFFAGVGTAGGLAVRYVYCMELTITSNRTFFGYLTNSWIGIGFFILALLAFLIRDWRWLLTGVSLLNVPFLLLWWLVPESPRWLLAKGRLDETQNVLEKIARENAHEVDRDTLHEAIKEVRRVELKRAMEAKKKHNILALIHSPRLRKRLIICCFCWLMNMIVYYEIILNIKGLSGDMYLNFFLVSFLHLPSQTLCWYFYYRLGRRVTYSVALIIAGVLLLLVAAVPSEQGSIATGLAITGLFFLSTTISGLYLFTAEQYPTVVRNFALGVSSMFGRLGATLAPYIILLAGVQGLPKVLPQIIMGICGITAAFAALCLPETVLSPMPQTVEQSDTWEEYYGLPCLVKRRPYTSFLYNVPTVQDSECRELKTSWVSSV